MNTTETPRASAGLLACAVLASVVLPGCFAVREPPPSVEDVAASGGATTVGATPAGTDAAASASVPLREKLGTGLLGLVGRHEEGGAKSVLAFARANGLDLNEMRVSVRVLATTEQDVVRLEQQIKDAGGSVESKFENSIFAAVPVAALGGFAAGEAVWRVDAQQRLSVPPLPTEPKAETEQSPKEEK